MNEQPQAEALAQESLAAEVDSLRRQLKAQGEALAAAQMALGWADLKLNTVLQLVPLIGAEGDTEEVLDQAAEIILRASECESATIFLLDPDREEVYFAAAKGPKGEAVKGLRLPRGQGIVGWTIEENQAVAISDVHRDPRFAKEISESVGYAVYSILSVPLRAHGRAVGAIEVLNKPRQEPFIANDIELVQTAANVVSVIVQRAGLLPGGPRRDEMNVGD